MQAVKDTEEARIGNKCTLHSAFLVMPEVRTVRTVRAAMETEQRPLSWVLPAKRERELGYLLLCSLE